MAVDPLPQSSPAHVLSAFSDMPPLFDALPEPFAESYDPKAPWNLLGDPLDAILEALPSSRIDIKLSPDVHLLGDGIVIGAGTHIGQER